MATAITEPKTSDEIVSVLAEKAKQDGDDFRIKIERRRTNGAPPELVSTLDGARVEHFSTPESWIPRFVGGGTLSLKAFHSSDYGKMIGMIGVNVEGQPKMPDLRVLESAEWQGPRLLVYPAAPPPRREEPISFLTTVPSTVDNGSPRTTPVGSNGGGTSSPDSYIEQRLAAKMEAIQKAELAILERSKMMEIEAARREADIRIRAAEDRSKDIERRLDEISRRPPPAPGTDSGAVLAQMMAEMRKSDREAQMQAAQQAVEMRKAEREAQAAQAAQQQLFQLEMAKLQAENARAAAESNKVLLSALIGKPAIDPAIAEMISKNDTSQLIASMSTMLTNTASQHLNMMSAMMDMGINRQPEPPRAPKKSGWESAASVLLPVVTRMLQPQPGQAAPQQVLAQPPPALPQGFSGIQQTAPTPAPAPVPSPSTPAPAGPTLVERLATVIQARGASAQDIAAMIVQNFSDPSLQAAATAAKGDPRVLFDSILSADWLDVKDNRTFAAEVMKIALEQGAASGLFPAEVVPEIPTIVQSFIESEAVAS